LIQLLPALCLQVAYQQQLQQAQQQRQPQQLQLQQRIALLQPPPQPQRRCDRPQPSSSSPPAYTGTQNCKEGQKCVRKMKCWACAFAKK
jgi:hypothetical protein